MQTKKLVGIGGWFFSVIIGVVVVFFFVGRPYRMFGDCMEPAIKDGQLCFLNKIATYFREYRIDDIILFKHEEKAWFARIVALENDTIEINEGRILVNGVVLQEAGVQRDWTHWKYGTYAIEKPMTVPSGHVYVLSDKLSAHHDDSRVFGPIKKSLILGVII